MVYISEGPVDLIRKIFDVSITLTSRSEQECVEAIRLYVNACVALSDRSKLVLCRRYGIYQQPATFKEIGALLHVTLERARQIHNAAIRTLRARRIVESELLYFCTARSPELANRTIHGLYAALSHAEDLLSSKTRALQQITDAVRGEVPSFPVEELRLSTRTENALKAAGIHTSNTLATFSRVELLALANISRVGLNQIITALAARGITLRN